MPKAKPKKITAALWYGPKFTARGLFQRALRALL
jgi:hypothetical protein